VPKTDIPAKKLALYDKLLATQKGVERKGASMPYTSLNGNMFSFLTKEGRLALRLPADARAQFTAKYKLKPLIQHGAVMKEYVAVPDALFAKTVELKPYFKLSLDYAKSLKPKPTKK
jgi:hypothetical protein